MWLLAGGALLAADPDSATFDARWLRELQSDEFQVRDAASQRITSAGGAAIEPLKQAAGAMDREAAARCIGVLEHLTRSPDAETARLAGAALSELETSGNSAVAELASAAIVKTEKISATPPLRVPAPPMRRVNMQFQFQGGGAGIRRTSTRIMNGQRTITIEDNGTTMVIEDTAGKDIRITVTKTENGGRVVAEYSGQDLDDLRKRSPTGAEIYEAATRGQGGAANLEKQRAELQARMEKLREASLLQGELTRQLFTLRRAGQAGTPEYEQLEQQLKDARDALRNIDRP